MDPINIEKIQAMNKYQRNQFLNNFFFYSFIAMTCSLFCLCSSPIWFPSLWSSMNVFLFVSLPSIMALVFNPKCLFIVCNIIVIILIGESKLVGSKSSPDTELYEEYIKSCRNHQRISTDTQVMKKAEKEMKLEVSLIEESVIKRVTEEEVKEEEVLLEDGETEEEEDDDEEEEEENGLPAEELNKRVEDFIARINRQRRLEATLLVCNSTSVY